MQKLPLPAKGQVSAVKSAASSDVEPLSVGVERSSGMKEFFRQSYRE